MAFTYASDFTLARDKIRLEIDDTIENDGPKPGGRNFSDAEIAYILEQEGSHIGRATAAAYEKLAAAWAKHEGSDRLGPTGTTYKQSDAYRNLAEAARGIHGYTAAAQPAGFSVQPRNNNR